MAKEDKPLDYQRRQVDTKTLAQRLVLSAWGGGHWLRKRKWQLAWLLPAVAAVASLPFVLGVGSSRKAFTNGAISRPHAMFEGRCAQCHTLPFRKVADSACKVCHDGPTHHANAIGEPRCAACHAEHRGVEPLAVGNNNCTECHANLKRHGKEIKLAALNVTAFARGKHPELSAHSQIDARPLKLNHAIHMPAQPKTIRGVKLPMKCVDCHSMDAAGELVPTNFDRHCASCHKGELGFDVYQVLGPEKGTAPHSKDMAGIGNFIRDAYTAALALDPSLPHRGLGRNVEGGASRAVWLASAIADSTNFLFEKKCLYCHETETRDGQLAVVKVGVLSGRFEKGRKEGPGWAKNAHFRHRPHRMVQCVSCHTQAAKSIATSDVLIPKMETCLPCHGRNAVSIDNCSGCHYYHDKMKETERDRKTVPQIVGDTN
ncbi:MAG: hypothetical protein HYZ37_01520 [Candidatus Solibacter usitatus]|nr:hypothetical protein [Candidatus Solibacter usitatus]